VVCKAVGSWWPSPLDTEGADGYGVTVRTGLRGYACTRPESRRPGRATANGFANETVQDEGDDARHRRRFSRPSPGQRNAPECGRRGDARRMAHNPATTDNAAARQYVAATKRNRGSEADQWRITRGMLLSRRPASCNDCTGYRIDGTRGAGSIRRTGPRTGPRPRPKARPHAVCYMT
jgi:hypothetical protein